jgi:hypothetical protein
MKKSMVLALAVLALAPAAFAADTCVDSAVAYVENATGQQVVEARKLGNDGRPSTPTEVFVKTSTCSYSVFFNSRFCYNVSRVLSWCE